MIKKLFLLFLFTSFTIIFAQQKYVMGNIKNDLGDHLSNIYIYNPRTEELALSDISGNYIIQAIPTDEIRIIKKGYERKSIRLSDIDFTKSVDITLEKLPFEIEEVEIGFHPTGNLKKDLAYFKTSEKTSNLNNEMTNYMKTPITTVVPKNTVPKDFAPNSNEGQINLLGVADAVSKLFQKKSKSNPETPNYSEIQDFYRRVKDVIDMQYFKNYGLSDYDFEIFLAYADQTQSLTKKFHKNFNKFAIETELKIALVEYLKKHKTDS